MRINLETTCSIAMMVEACSICNGGRSLFYCNLFQSSNGGRSLFYCNDISNLETTSWSPFWNNSTPKHPYLVRIIAAGIFSELDCIWRTCTSNKKINELNIFSILTYYCTIPRDILDANSWNASSIRNWWLTEPRVYRAVHGDKNLNL